jgi:hypothetical protein
MHLQLPCRVRGMHGALAAAGVNDCSGCTCHMSSSRSACCTCDAESREVSQGDQHTTNMAITVTPSLATPSTCAQQRTTHSDQRLAFTSGPKAGSLASLPSMTSEHASSFKKLTLITAAWQWLLPAIAAADLLHLGRFCCCCCWLGGMQCRCSVW